MYSNLKIHQAVSGVFLILKTAREITAAVSNTWNHNITAAILLITPADRSLFSLSSSPPSLTPLPFRSRFHSTNGVPCRGQRRRQPLHHRLHARRCFWDQDAGWDHGGLPRHPLGGRRLALAPSHAAGPAPASQCLVQMPQCLRR